MTLVVYHRCYGRSLGLPPNALSSLKWAVSNDAQAVEYDVFYCKDNGAGRMIMLEPKLLKEPNLNPDNLTFEEIKKIVVNGNLEYPEYPADLRDVLASVPSHVAQQIHLKSRHPQTAQTILSLLNEKSNCLITSFDLEALKEVRFISPGMAIGWLVNADGKSAPEGLRDLTKTVSAGAEHAPYSQKDLQDILNETGGFRIDYIILCAPKMMNAESVDFFHSRGIRVGAWGVADNFDTAKRMLSIGVDRFTFDMAEKL